MHLGLEKRAGIGGLGQLQIVTSWSNLSVFKGAHIHMGIRLHLSLHWCV